MKFNNNPKVFLNICRPYWIYTERLKTPDSQYFGNYWQIIKNKSDEIQQ